MGASATILHLYTHSDWGGAVEHIALLCRHGALLGDRVLFAGPRQASYRARFEAWGIPWLDFEVAGKWDLRAARRLRALCRRHQVTVLHTHSRALDPAACLATLGREAPLLLTTLHDRPGIDQAGAPSRTISTAIYFAMLRRVFDHVICVSEALRHEAITRAGVRANRASVIANGIDLEKLRVPCPRAEMRRLLGVSDSLPLIGALGRMTQPKKGFDRFLDALALLRDAGRDFRAVLVGDGEARNALLRRRDDLGLRERVSFAAFTARPADYYHALDLCCVPSRFEGMPRVLLEAMACGAPVAAAPFPGALEALGKGERGLIAASERDEDLARCLTAALDDRAAALERARIAKSFVLHHHGAPAMAKATHALYRSLLVV